MKPATMELFSELSLRRFWNHYRAKITINKTNFLFLLCGFVWWDPNSELKEKNIDEQSKREIKRSENMIQYEPSLFYFLTSPIFYSRLYSRVYRRIGQMQMTQVPQLWNISLPRGSHPGSFDSHPLFFLLFNDAIDSFYPFMIDKNGVLQSAAWTGSEVSTPFVVFWNAFTISAIPFFWFYLEISFLFISKKGTVLSLMKHDF